MITSAFRWKLASALLLVAAAASSFPGRARAENTAAAATVEFGPAILDTWVQPQYPAQARAANQEGEVRVELVVEADGTVSRAEVRKSSDAIFEEPALAAVRQWRFRPALDGGKPAASGMAVVVVFTEKQLRQKTPPVMPDSQMYMPYGLPVEPAAAAGGMDPDYPSELDEKLLPGVVRIRFTVDPAGRAQQPAVLFASHPAFVESALRTLERAEFKPARQGLLARSDQMEYPVYFESLGKKPAEVLAANRIELIAPADVVVPLPAMLMQPTFPRTLLLAGAEGSATAEFTVGPDGQTGEIQITESTHPEFAAALRAAVESWAFRPARNEGGPVTARLRVRHAFAANSVEVYLAALLQPGAAGIGPAKGLDQKLKPLWRGFPTYPKSFVNERPAGRAVIEFVVDRGGRARLPQVIEATAPEFGWAAASAISQWVFEPPRRGGEAVDVTVRIPVDFSPPKS